MDRIIEEHQIGRYTVAIIEELTDEGAQYVLLIDGVLAAENGPLDHVPTEEEMRSIMRTHGFR